MLPSLPFAYVRSNSLHLSFNKAFFHFLFFPAALPLSLSLSLSRPRSSSKLVRLVCCSIKESSSDPENRKEMKKIVCKLDLHDDNAKRKAMKTVATLSGIDSITMDMKERKLTVIGTVDPIHIVSKLRKLWPTTEIILVGPAKEPEKAEKKEEPKKEEGKQEEPKESKNEEPKKEESKKEEGKEEEKKPDAMILDLIKAHNKQMQYYYPPNPMPRYYYPVQSMEENPNASCAIL